MLLFVFIGIIISFGEKIVKHADIPFGRFYIFSE